MEQELEPLDIHCERLLSLADAAKRFGVSNCSVMRWVRFGQKGVLLGARKLGAKWYTSEEALQRFSDRLTAVELGGLSTGLAVDDQRSGIMTTKVKLLQASDQAGRELRMMGVHGVSLKPRPHLANCCATCISSLKIGCPRQTEAAPAKLFAAVSSGKVYAFLRSDRKVAQPTLMQSLISNRSTYARSTYGRCMASGR